MIISPLPSYLYRSLFASVFDFFLHTICFFIRQDANPLQKLRWKFVDDAYDIFMDGEDNMMPYLNKHEEDIKQLIHGPKGSAGNRFNKADSRI